MTTNFTIDLIPDSSVAQAPAGFAAAVAEAASMYEAAFHNPITLNISYGWGTFDDAVDDTLIGSGGAIGGPDNGNYISYPQLKALLLASPTSTDDRVAYASLPANSSSFPGGDDTFYLASAQQKALGDYTGDASALDGSIGFGTASTSDDWLAEALHEIGHAIGRMTDYYVGAPTIMDLFRYSSPGVYQWIGGAPAYFSIDGGKTDIADFGVTSDYSDWNGDSLTTNDPFNEDVGTIDYLTSKDIELMNVLGFDTQTHVAPTVQAQSISVEALRSTPAASLIASIANPSDDSLTQDIYMDESGGAGHFTVNGVAQADGQWIYPTSGSTVLYVGGASPGTDTVEVGVYDATTSSYVYSSPVSAVTTANTSPPSLAIGALVFTGGSSFTLAGTASDSVGVASVEISQATTNLGAASLDAPTGAWSFAGAATPDDDIVIEATATDNAGNAATATAYDVTGGGQTVDLQGSGDLALLSSATSARDMVLGADGKVELSSARAKVIGASDEIYFTGGSGNVATLADTAGDLDKVFGSGGKVSLADSQARVVGGGDVVRLLSGDDDLAKLTQTDGDADSASGSGERIRLIGAQASLTGSDDTIRMSGDSALTQNGASDAFVFGPVIGHEKIRGFGSTDTMRLSASDFADWSALSSAISQSGANTVITLDPADKITLTGVASTSLAEAQFSFV